MNYPPPFGQPPQSQPQYPRPGMPPGQFGFGPPPGMPYPPFQPGAMPPGARPPFQPPSMFTRPPMTAGAPSGYQSQMVHHAAAPVMKPPPIATPAQPEMAPTTVYIGNITERYADYTIAEILSSCGAMLSWKRVKGADSKLQAFGFCEFERPDAALRAVRVLNDLVLGGDRKLVVKVDPKTQDRLVEWQKTKLSQSGKKVDALDLTNMAEHLEERTRIEDRIAKEKIEQIIAAANNTVVEADRDKPVTTTELPKKTLHGLEIEEERRHLISKEIRNFRATDEANKSSSSKSKDSRESRDTRDSRDSRDSRESREPRESRDSRDSRESREPRETRESKESNLAAAAVSPPSLEASLPRTPPPRQDPASVAAAATTATTAQAIIPGVAGAPAEPVIDEEELAERRRAERRAREKAERYADRVKSWESRERERGRNYARNRDKEAETKRKQESDARKLKEFLEDYDDVRDDPKYYRGSALSRRLKDREQEIEADSRDRKREREEMEDVRRKLREQGCRNLEEEMEKLERATTEHLLPRLRGDENSPSHGQMKTGSSPHSDSTQSLDQHIQLLSSKLIRQEGDGDAGDDTNMDGAGNRQFVPARFEAVGSSMEATAQPSPQQQPSSRKRPEPSSSSTHDDEKADGAGAVVGDAATLSLKLSINKAKRLAAAISVVANADMGSTASTGMNRLGLLTADNDSSSTSAGASSFLSEESKKERIQQLIQSIPTAKEELFAYPIDWGVVDKTLMEKRVRPWIDKKIVEYIGEKEPTLSEFLSQKVLARTAPDKILEDIGVIFDEDAPLFVVKLWRLLVYETEARKQGLVKM